MLIEPRDADQVLVEAGAVVNRVYGKLNDVVLGH